MNDIVERLRSGGARCDWGIDFAECPEDDCPECLTAAQAADEIERLRALIIQWAYWDDSRELDAEGEFACARLALRQAVGR